MPRFTGTLRPSGRGAGFLVEVPFDPKALFGRVRVPVRVTVNGHTFRTTLMRYGGVVVLGMNRQAREAARVGPGDGFVVDVELDREPREVEVPPALAAALAADPGARSAFDALSYTHRREYAEWVAEAKRAETKARRAERAVAMLREGAKEPGQRGATRSAAAR